MKTSKDQAKLIISEVQAIVEEVARKQSEFVGPRKPIYAAYSLDGKRVA